MNTKLIYWTLNSKHEAFFLDSDIQFRRVSKHDKPVIGREEAEQCLAELRPHHQSIWVDSPEMLHRIAIEMKTNERDLDTRPLVQIAAIIRQNAPQWHSLNQQARFIAKLAEQYEQGQINQSCLLRGIRECVNQQGQRVNEQNSQSQHFPLFLCELADIQLA